MRARKVPCYYNQSNLLIKKLGDLKIEYATTQCFLIKSLLRQSEELIIFRVGTKQMILDRIKAQTNPTLEQICFFEKLKKVLG